MLPDKIHEIIILGPTSAGKTTLVHNFIYTLGKKDVFKSTHLRKLELQISLTGIEYHNPANLEEYDPRIVSPTSGEKLWIEHKIGLKISLPNISTIFLAITDSQGKIQHDVSKQKGHQPTMKNFNKIIDKADAKIIASSWLNKSEDIDFFFNKYHGENVVYCYNRERSSDQISHIDKHTKVINNKYGLCAIPNHSNDLQAFQFAALAPFFHLIDTWYHHVRLIEALETEIANGLDYADI